MGYLTNFELSATDEIAEAVEAAILEVSGYRFEGGYLSDVKWYDWEDDMRAVSKRFPGHLISLYGNGEEDGDIWRAYFANGKMQHCQAKITFDPYDENQLT